MRLLTLALILLVSLTMGIVFSEIPPERAEALWWVVIVAIAAAALVVTGWAGRAV